LLHDPADINKFSNIQLNDRIQKYTTTTLDFTLALGALISWFPTWMPTSYTPKEGNDNGSALLMNKLVSSVTPTMQYYNNFNL
jgi:hypothetical protein